MRRAIVGGFIAGLALGSAGLAAAFTLEEIGVATGIHDTVAGTSAPSAGRIIDSVKGKISSAKSGAPGAWEQSGSCSGQSGSGAKAWAKGGDTKGWVKASSPSKSGGGSKAWATAGSKGGGWKTAHDTSSRRAIRN